MGGGDEVEIKSGPSWLCWSASLTRLVFAQLWVEKQIRSECRGLIGDSWDTCRMDVSLGMLSGWDLVQTYT